MPSGYMAEMLSSCRAQHACATMACHACLGRMALQVTARMALNLKMRSMQRLQSTCAQPASTSASGKLLEPLGELQGH